MGNRIDLKEWSLTLALSAWGLCGSALASAQVPVRSLLEPDARLSRPFDRVTGLRELRDGRVVVVDANEQSVLVVDFTKSTAVQIGRMGSGPGEYRFPMRLLRLGGDSIGVEDGGNQRILVITGKGKFSGILSALGMRVANKISARGEPPRASDGQGRLYALGFSNFTPEAKQPSDSAPIERWRLGSLVRDTVAYLPLPPVRERTSQPGEGTRAFATKPQWAVGLEGQIAILHVNPYSVDLIDSKGARLKGRPIPYRRIRLSEAHKRQWRDEQSRPRPVMMMAPGAAAPTAGLRPWLPTEPVQWPAFLPPFLEDAGRFAPDGFLWIQRTTVADRPEVFDIVDRRGIVVEQVSTPPRTRLVGFGQSHIYLVRIDPDNQEFLERYTAISSAKP